MASCVESCVDLRLWSENGVLCEGFCGVLLVITGSLQSLHLAPLLQNRELPASIQLRLPAPLVQNWLRAIFPAVTIWQVLWDMIKYIRAHFMSGRGSLFLSLQTGEVMH